MSRLLRSMFVVVLTLSSGCGLATARGPARTPEVLALEGDVSPVHDPAVIKHGDTWYVFVTGGRPGEGIIPIFTSTNLRTWKASGHVFASLPEWTSREIPRARNAWAPDISFYNGKYHLYYSLSSFGSRNSAIALATNRTLAPSSPDYRWIDEGMVLRSLQERDNWNRRTDLESSSPFNQFAAQVRHRDALVPPGPLAPILDMREPFQ